MHCKSLWIKASAKCINVNVKYSDHIELAFQPPSNHSEHFSNHPDSNVLATANSTLTT